jgi:hypothetical protein
MFNRHSIGRSIRSDSASAARVRAAAVGYSGGWRGVESRAGDAVRLNSGGAVMTADRVDHGSRRAMRLAGRATGEAFVAPDALGLVSPEAFTSPDCPEARMAGDHHHHNNNKLR